MLYLFPNKKRMAGCFCVNAETETETAIAAQKFTPTNNAGGNVPLNH